MKKFAFVDVLNTGNSAEKMLGFSVDWNKLADYLLNTKSCSKVFFYTGIENGDTETAEVFDVLSKIDGCIVRSKPIFAYKNTDKKIAQICPSCGTETVHTIDMGYTKKSNCDVELGVDAIELAGPETQFFLFTGDGDFEYLIRKALDKGVEKVYIYSYAVRIVKAGVTISRFSTKLRALIAEQSRTVFYTSLKDIKEKIKRDLPKV